MFHTDVETSIPEPERLNCTTPHDLEALARELRDLGLPLGEEVRRRHDQRGLGEYLPAPTGSPAASNVIPLPRAWSPLVPICRGAPGRRRAGAAGLPGLRVYVEQPPVLDVRRAYDATRAC